MFWRAQLQFSLCISLSLSLWFFLSLCFSSSVFRKRKWPIFKIGGAPHKKDKDSKTSHLSLLLLHPSSHTLLSAVSKSIDRRLLFGFDFLTMVCILAGGGGLVLLLIIITLVCCCLSRRKSQMHFEEERELRLAPLTKTQHPYHSEGQTKHPSHPEGQKQRQRPPGGAPPGSTGPRPTARASNQAEPQPRAQARGRPPQTPLDDDEEHPPPLPQPRKKGPHPPRHWVWKQV